MASKPSRNDPCPCGSGQKYKRCCLPKDQRESSTGIEEHPIGRTPFVVLGVGIFLAVVVGAWRGVGPGLIVAAAWGLAAMAWLSFRHPPPPNPTAGNPAALDFGMSDKKKKR